MKQLINEGGALGMLMAPAAIVFWGLNSKLIGEAMEVVLDRAGYVLLTLQVLGQSIDITDLLLYGAALGIAQFLLGAELAERFKEKSPMRWLILFGAAVPLVLLEDFVSAWRGYVLGGLVLAGINGLLAHVCCSVELISGYRGIHLLAVPLIKAIFWALVAPIRAAQRLATRLTARRTSAKPPKKKDHDAPGILTYIGAYTDIAVFDPFRSIEQSLGRWFGRKQ
ncbi:MAG: hypothetical protein FJ145_15750 [Deltaproteobacteria bacterium]|nr:hypothetical protein [Deltaproteobacteria bacterium]